MSLLVDLLSRAKTKEPGRDVPPGLQRAVLQGTMRNRNRRKVILLSVLVLAVLLGGFGTVYVLETFRTSLSATVAGKTYAKQKVPLPVLRDERPLSPSKAEPRVHAANAASKVPSPETSTLERPKQTVRAGIPEAGGDPLTKTGTNVPTAVKAPLRGKDTAPVDEAVNPERVHQNTGKDVYLFAGRTHEAKGEFKQAIDSYMKALEMDAANYMVMNNISGVYIRLKLFNEALSYAGKALNIKTNYIPALVNAGIAHVSLGNLAEGEAFLVRAVSLEPANSSALFNLGVLFEKQERYDKAFDHYHKLSRMREVDGYLGAARVLERQGRNSEAVRFYREILATETASPAARQLAHQRLSQFTR